MILSKISRVPGQANLIKEFNGTSRGINSYFLETNSNRKECKRTPVEFKRISATNLLALKFLNNILHIHTFKHAKRIKFLSFLAKNKTNQHRFFCFKGSLVSDAFLLLFSSFCLFVLSTRLATYMRIVFYLKVIKRGLKETQAKKKTQAKKTLINNADFSRDLVSDIVCVSFSKINFRLLLWLPLTQKS